MSDTLTAPLAELAHVKPEDLRRLTAQTGAAADPRQSLRVGIGLLLTGLAASVVVSRKLRR